MKTLNQGKAVVITGASTGIGRAIATDLASKGFRVFAGVRKPADAEVLLREAVGALTPIMLDVTDEASIVEATRTVSAQTSGKLHGLINNAGVGLGGPLELLPTTEIRTVMEVNVIGLLAVTKAFLPMLRQARGRIVNIGSLAGLLASPGASAYAASKFGVEAITDSLRLELKPFGVQVTVVDPGAVESAIWDKSRTQKETIIAAAPQELRDLYAPLLETGKRLAENPRGIVPASAVAKDVAHALTAKRAKVRYLVGPGAKKAAKLASWPVWLRDWLMCKFLMAGVDRHSESANSNSPLTEPVRG